MRDVFDGCVERFLVLLRGHSIAADLAYELERRGVHFVVGWILVGTAQGNDASAHPSRIIRVGVSITVEGSAQNLRPRRLIHENPPNDGLVLTESELVHFPVYSRLSPDSAPLSKSSHRRTSDALDSGQI